MNNVQEVKELLSGISSQDVMEILNENDDIATLKKRFKQYGKSTRGAYFASKIFEIKFKDKIICKWTEKDVEKFAYMGYSGTKKYGLRLASLHHYVGDIPEEHESTIEQLVDFEEHYRVGKIKLIADSMSFAVDPYLLYEINDVYYVVGKWGDDIKIAEEEQRPTKKRWFGLR